MAYDYLKSHTPAHANREYLKLLYLSAKETEEGVDKAFAYLFDRQQPITVQAVEGLLKGTSTVPSVEDVKVAEVNLAAYDELLEVVYG